MIFYALKKIQQILLNILETKPDKKKETSLKRKPPIDWWKNPNTKSQTKSENPSSVKKKKKEQSSYTCLECLDLVSKGQREESTSRICRNDNSSINRHKKHWHKNEEKCTIVPTDSDKVIMHSKPTKSIKCSSEQSEIKLIKHRVKLLKILFNDLKLMKFLQMILN